MAIPEQPRLIVVIAGHSLKPESGTPLLMTASHNSENLERLNWYLYSNLVGKKGL